MRIFLQSGSIAALLLLSFQAHAELPNFTAGQPYQEVKAELIKQGWKPVKNAKISNSSLYAQEVFQLGLDRDERQRGNPGMQPQTQMACRRETGRR